MHQTLYFGTTTLVIQSVDTAPLTSGGRSSLLEAQRATVGFVVRELCGDDAKIGHYDNGAPFVEGHRHLNVSISHCAEFVAVAIDEKRHVGVDVESPRIDQLRRVVERVLLSGEEAYRESDELMMRAWTLKEAIYKCAQGLGFSTISQIRLPAINDSEVEIKGCKFTLYTFANLGYTGCSLALAISER